MQVRGHKCHKEITLRSKKASHPTSQPCPWSLGITVSSLSQSHLPGHGVRFHVPDASLGSWDGPPLCLFLQGLQLGRAGLPTPPNPPYPHATWLHTWPPPQIQAASLPATNRWPVTLHSGLQLGLSCKRLERSGMTKGAWRLIRSSNESLIHKSKHFPSINLQPVKGNV